MKKPASLAARGFLVQAAREARQAAYAMREAA